MQERGVEFYADKLCLSPKYLSAVSKSICGYTVQELVFKAIIRKCISLLKNTQKNIQENLQLRKLLSIPDDCIIVFCAVIGYPLYRYQIPTRKDIK